MKGLHQVSILLSAISLAVIIGCNNKPDDPPKSDDKPVKKDEDKPKKDEHDHGETGPHGGTIIEFGNWHGEFKVDHKTQEATVFILGEDAKTPAPLQVEKLLLSIKTPQFQVDLKAAPEKGDPMGKSSRFVGKHEHFGKEQEFEGTLSGVVDGKPYAGDFKEEEHKDHKKKKK